MNVLPVAWLHHLGEGWAASRARDGAQISDLTVCMEEQWPEARREEMR